MSAAVSNTFENRFVRISDDEYHADPCAFPSLSSSIANVLDQESALHAWARHPRLGGIKRRPTKSMDHGSLSHALLLGSGKEVEIIDAKDYRTNAAKERRDEAEKTGRIPVLVADYAEAKRTAMKLRERFNELGIVLDGESELTALWTETARNGHAVQCRGMLDHVKLPVIYDLKSIRSAKPDVCRKHIESYGYAVQRAAYVSAVERIKPELAGRVDFIFVFYELEPPHAVTPMRLSGAFRELGTRAWKRSVNRWEWCLRNSAWPAYADGIISVEPSTWALTKDTEREEEENDG